MDRHSSSAAPNCKRSTANATCTECLMKRETDRKNCLAHWMNDVECSSHLLIACLNRCRCRRRVVFATCMWREYWMGSFAWHAACLRCFIVGVDARSLALSQTDVHKTPISSVGTLLLFAINWQWTYEEVLQKQHLKRRKKIRWTEEEVAWNRINSVALRVCPYIIGGNVKNTIIKHINQWMIVIWMSRAHAHIRHSERRIATCEFPVLAIAPNITASAWISLMLDIVE